MAKKKYYKLDEVRFRYLTKVYGYTTLSFIATIFQWTLVREIKPVLLWFDKYPMIAIFFWLPALILIFVLTHFTEIRQRFCINWILFATAVESLTVGFAFTLTRGTEFMFILIFFSITVEIIILVLMGHFMMCDLTRQSLFMFTLMLLLFIIVIVCIIMNVILEFFFFMKIGLAGTALLLLALFQIYIVQLAQGGRYLELRTTEIVLPVAITYMVAIMGYISIYMIIEVMIFIQHMH